MKHLLLSFGLAAFLLPHQAFAAIGCTLSNPAEDLKYLFPEMTTYKEELEEFPRLNNGADLFRGLKARLGSDLDPIYETFQTPYTIYSVFKGQTKIGIVHGVNVPGHREWPGRLRGGASRHPKKSHFAGHVRIQPPF